MNLMHRNIEFSFLNIVRKLFEYVWAHRIGLLLHKIIGIPEYRIASILDYVGQTPSASVVGILKDRVLFCSKPRYDGADESVCYKEVGPDYVVCLHDVCIRAAENIVIAEDKYLLNDILSGDESNRFEYGNILSYRDKYALLLNKNAMTVKKSETINVGVMLSGNYSFNYYHFTLELMPRMRLIDKYVPSDIPLLLDSDMRLFPQFVEMMNIFNTKRRKMIILTPHSTYVCNTLYYPSISSYIVPNTKYREKLVLTDCMFDKLSLSFICEKMLTVKSNYSFPRKIFLYRTSSLRTFNQDEVWESLQPYGFEKIIIDKLSLADQVALFNNADMIIGGSGAAFTNLIYCKNTAKAFVITGGVYDNIAVFSSLASFVGMDLYYIAACQSSTQKDSERENIHKGFTIEPTRVADYVKNVQKHKIPND